MVRFIVRLQHVPTFRTSFMGRGSATEAGLKKAYEELKANREADLWG